MTRATKHLTGIIFSIIIYLGFAIYYWDFNSKNWMQQDRLACFLLMVLGYLVTIFILKVWETHED